MNRIIATVTVFLVALSVRAGVAITDHFNRADRSLTPDGALIGANWVSTGGLWGLKDQRLIQDTSSSTADGNSVLYNTAVSTVSGDRFTVSLDVMALDKGINTWAGIVFNCLDVHNFYYFRYKANAGNYSLSRRVDSKISHMVNRSISGEFATNTDYTLTVSSSKAYTFDYEIRETLSGTVLVSGTITDANATWTSGYAGILQASRGSMINSFDNFSLMVSRFIEQFADDGDHSEDDAVSADTKIPEGEHVGKGWQVSIISSLKKTSMTNSIGMELVSIAPGSFLMGQDGPPADYHMVNHPEKFDDADWDEKPVRKVEISTGFYMGATEVTLEQYRLFDPGFDRHGGAADEAVRFVSWHDAMAFCEWLSAKEGKPYRLPTEAEWEFACRAGATTLFHFGDTLPPGFHAWFGNDNFRAYFFRDRAMPVEYRWRNENPVLRVAQTPPNAWGLYDLHGNVAEWCADWYGPYEAELKADPLGRSDGDFRVIRGGSHSVFTRQLRSANRAAWLPEASNDKTGFRVVMGTLPSGQILPRNPSPEEAVSQDSVRVEAAPADVPFFSGPKPFVIIPPSARGPLFSRHNHSPSITECPNGDLLAVWFSCVLEQGIELCNASSRLRYGSSEWEPALPFWDGPDINDHAPKVWWDGDNTLFHFASGVAEKIMRTSTDNGVTWSKARIISPRRQEFGSRLLRLRDGTLVLSSDDRREGLVYSHDGGELWESNDVEGLESDFRPGGQGYRYPGIHAAIVELSDGRIMALSRIAPNDQAAFEFKTPASYSADLGKTWTYEMTEFPAIGSTQRAEIIRMREGPILFCSFTDQRSAFDNPAGLTFKAADGSGFTGYGLFAAVSYDEGRTWPVRRLITPGGPDRIVQGHSEAFTLGDTKAERNGYLDVTQTRDGNIQLITSKNHYVFNLAWLEALPDVPKK